MGASRFISVAFAGRWLCFPTPGVEDEAFRDVICCVEVARGDLMRARHHVSEVLLRRGQRHGEGEASSANQLRRLRISPSPAA